MSTQPKPASGLVARPAASFDYGREIGLLIFGGDLYGAALLARSAQGEIERVTAERDEAIARREPYVKALGQFKANTIADHQEARDDLASAIGWVTPGITIDDVAQMAVGYIEGRHKEIEGLESERAFLAAEQAALLRLAVQPWPSGGFAARLPWRPEGYGTGEYFGGTVDCYWFEAREAAEAAVIEAAGLTTAPAVPDASHCPSAAAISWTPVSLALPAILPLDQSRPDVRPRSAQVLAVVGGRVYPGHYYPEFGWTSGVSQGAGEADRTFPAHWSVWDEEVRQSTWSVAVTHWAAWPGVEGIGEDKEPTAGQR